MRHPRPRTSHAHTRAGGSLALVVTVAVLFGSPAAAAPSGPVPEPRETTGDAGAWAWPLTGGRVVVRFIAPEHPYGPGHRGVDLSPGAEDVVRAPADGVVAFAGTVVDRGVVTIDQGAGLVTTFEPVDPDVVPGRPVRRGDVVGTIAAGGHAPEGTLHFGVRRDGEYVNPLLLLGEVPRAVLLPCCT